MTREELITPQLTEELRDHARSVYPHEACGMLLKSGYKPLENMSDNPEEHARFPAEEVVAAQMAGDIVALFHSHTNGIHCPSAQDMRSQIQMAVPYLLVTTDGEACTPVTAWGDQLEPPPLLGRPFQSGVTDCYELGRDWYRMERGILLPSWPRNWRWWESGANHIVDNYTSLGFEDLHDDQPREIGDVVILTIRSEVPNHVGIYVGEDLLLHHPGSMIPWDPAKLSRRDPLNRWRNYEPRWMRLNAADKTSRSAG